MEDNVLSQASDSPEGEKGGLSRTEFAKRAGFSVSTVIRLQDAGILPKVQPGGFRHRVLVPRSALESLLNAASAGEDAKPTVEAITPKRKTKPGPRPGWMNS